MINIYLHERKGIPLESRSTLTNRLEAFLAPIYIALRRKGYNQVDLWG